MIGKKPDPWVFRDGRETISSSRLLGKVNRSLQNLFDSPHSATHCTSALLQCGGFEAALDDADSPCARRVAVLTDAVADHFCCGNLDEVRQAAAGLDHLTLPKTVVTSSPEGFSYYAVHPADYANVAIAMARQQPVAVVGIRNIGATLSAVVAAALRHSGHPAARITVRPTGHAYDRVTQFNPKQAEWVQVQQENSAIFLVVDEGPGRSGSTFLSVGEALLANDVPAQRIILMGSREPDLNSLCGRDAAARWNRFRFLAANSRAGLRFGDCAYLGGGEWRNILLPTNVEWPACWPQMERLKFLSPDRTQFFKFEGLGSFGEAAMQRAYSAAHEGFGCAVQDAGDGFASYTVQKGEPLTARDVSESLLERVAAYCAFRLAEFGVSHVSDGSLADMVRSNIAEEFHIDWNGDAELLQSAHPAITDGRLLPHEWIRTRQDVLLKTDATSHGDDHFFPGPCDIAWDLAGAAVEWNLSSEAIGYLLRKFRQCTGNDARSRLPSFLLAYTVFRMAYCRMALTTVSGSPEEVLLHKACFRYRVYARRLLRMRESITKPFLPAIEATG